MRCTSRRAACSENAFDRLTVGSVVSFVEEPGEKGPQASTVKLTRPHRRTAALTAESAAPAGQSG